MMHPLLRLALAALLLSCAGAGPAGDAPGRTERPASAALPAWPLPGERQGKADAAADRRASAPEHYALTVPPALAVRPMVEWEPMRALALTAHEWLTHEPQVKQAIVSIIEATTPVADVWVLFGAAQVRTALESALASSGADLDRITWLHVPHDSIWMVDYGPFPIVDPVAETTAFVDFRYFDGRPLDDAVPTRMARLLGGTTYRPSAAFEGGNLLADGHGACFTTQRGLQQSGLAEAAFAAEHRDYLGCERLHVLHDLAGDPTGHVDMFMKIVGDGRIVLGRYDDAVDDGTNQTRLEDNLAILESLTVAGGAYEITRVPMPGTHVEEAPGGLGKVVVPLTYVNATHINGVNLWPRYADPAWEGTFAEAQAAWSAAMPDYQHVPIVADALAKAGGAIHCITRTIPTPPLQAWVPDGTCEAGTCAPPDGYEQVAMSEPCETGDVCFGPAWLCGCNDCDGPCGEAPADACGAISFEGCCAGQTLTWCDDGALKTKACGAASCGWDAQGGYYSCDTAGGRSPYPEFPHGCPCTPSCDGRACGDDGCGGICGTCPATLECSAAGQCLDPEQPCTVGCEPDGADGGPPPVAASPASPNGCATSPRPGDAEGETQPRSLW